MKQIATDVFDSTEALDTLHLDATALRLLNVFFLLHTSPAPVATAQIIDSKELGYGGQNRDSERTKFKRDRNRLAEAGIIIREVKPKGSSEREESFWEIDRSQTHAQAGVLEREDAEALLAAIDEHFSLQADDPLRWPLQRARVKLLELVQNAESSCSNVPQKENTALRHVWSAYLRKRVAQFTYQPKDSEARERKVEIYSIFAQGNHSYLVGRCLDSNKIHTFRTDRIVSARKSPNSGKGYHVPRDFSPSSFHFLPFDFSSSNPMAAQFSFPASCSEHELALLTHKRGKLKLSSDETRWLWDIDVRNLREAAAFALSHTRRGMCIESPRTLIDLAQELKEQAVCAHVE